MNLKHCLSISLLASTAAFAADATTSVTPFVSYRSQSQDLARQMSGSANHIYKAGMNTFYGNFSATPEYTQSFDGNKIFHTLFGCYYPQGCNNLNITGLSIQNRNPKDLLADWFNLPSNYEGSVSFEPSIKNFNLDLDLFWGMDAWVKGMFFRVHAPLTWTQWNLGAKFTTNNPGSFFVSFLDDAEKFFCSKGKRENSGAFSEPLLCARFCGCHCDKKTKTGLADIQADFGWTFLKENYHFGFFTRLVAPTGTTPKGEWLFEPIIGNGHFWELGGGVTGSWVFWHNQEKDKHLGFYINANITHLFNAEQSRVFDLKNNPLSRYMITTNNSHIIEGNPFLTLGSIANVTSCTMNVSIPVQADITAMINYTHKNWSFDLGYDFWARSCEQFNCTACGNCSSCDDNCNDCCGKCIVKNGNLENWLIVPNANIHEGLVFDGFTLKLTDSMIDYNGARTKGMSNKVFGHVAYSWNDREVVPFLGLGGSTEFGRNDDCCNNNCCRYASLSQWGIWLKGGASF